MPHHLRFKRDLYLLTDQVNVDVVLEILVQLDNIRVILVDNNQSVSIKIIDIKGVLTSCCRILTSVWKRSQFLILERGMTLIARF